MMGQLTLAWGDDLAPVREAIERWLPAPRWDGYEVSDLGRVRSWRNRGGKRRAEPLVLAPGMNHGHLRVGLSAGGAGTMRLARVDKMVLEAFRGPYPDDAGFGYEGKVIHADGDEWNCRLDNLRWKEPVRLPTEADIKQRGERWLPIADWPGYEVSDWGRVGTWIRGARFKILKPWVGKKNGYPYVGLVRADGTKRKYLVHRLVMEAFVGPCPDGMEVCHDPDPTRTNCRLDNLKYADHFENMADAIRHGNIKPAAPAERVGPFLFADPFIPLEALIPWEVWKGLRDFDGYEASNHGRIRSYWTNAGIGETPEIVIGSTDEDGRRYVTLRAAPYVGKGRAVSRLVLETFSPPPEPGLVGRHVDGDCTNDFLRNLRWGSTQENARDKIHHGTILRGESHPMAKLTVEKVREIRRRRKAGESRKALGAEFGIHNHYVKLVEEGKRWGWIDEIPEPAED